MFDSHQFYKNRLSAHIKNLSRYLRYIFNGHIAFAMFFFISASAYYYQQWLANLPENFPTAIIIGIVFGLIVSYSPIRTLLQEPDLVFLIPAEKQMKNYFRNSLIYSFVIQLYLVLLFAAALAPLYFATFPEREGSMYFTTLAVLLLWKVANLFANWWMLKVREPSIRHIDLLTRTVLNVVIFYFMVAGNMLMTVITVTLFIIVLIYDFWYTSKQAGILWDLLIEKDNSRMQSFYRIANMFAEVPHLKNRVKRRSWLVSLIVKGIPFSKEATYAYLYRISFVRSGDYVGMYIRLIIIGGIFIWIMPNSWIKILFGLLFLYLSTFQMMSLYQHHRTNIWLDIYPVPQHLKIDAVLSIIRQLGIIQAILFSLLFLFLGDWLGFVIMMIVGVIFTITFTQGYIRGKFQQTSNI
ncbi:ABC transporter permease [Oceanobacillus sp. 1P07AA]|uniref:ABC transporter permease n=1 Tax=Oceanobacillus sp. 1P07AA TaxID=3132293 RepID=UPI0039A607B6